jgi:hypothetical protein
MKEKKEVSAKVAQKLAEAYSIECELRARYQQAHQVTLNLAIVTADALGVPHDWVYDFQAGAFVPPPQKKAEPVGQKPTKDHPALKRTK